MEDREKDIIDRLKAKSETIPIPETLKPEEIKKQLESKTSKERLKNPSRITKNFEKKQMGGLAVLAAAVVLVCLLWPVFQKVRNPISTDSSSKKSEMESETLTWETADDYDTIYEYIQEDREQTEQNQRRAVLDGGAGRLEDERAQTAGRETAQNSASYSKTNVRQNGVDEGDVAKTDGRYIFTLTEDQQIAIVDTQDGLKHVGTISENGSIQEFYIVGEQLVLVCGQDDLYGSSVNKSSIPDGTRIITYDISNRSEPVKKGEVNQSGQYHSSRLAGNFLYTFSTFYVDTGASLEERERYIPSAGGSLMNLDDLYLPTGEGASQYLVMTAIDMEHPGELSDSRAIFAKNGELYVSNDNIYWYEENTQYWGINDERNSTLIRKIAYKEGKLEAKAQGIVPGIIDDSFSIDEYNGNLRVVTTNESGNGLYIFNQNMEEIGRIDQLAKGERVYSARLLGDIGYFVTFRNTDPLFSVDLSDPENPRIIGKLKIPGFSEYLHFYGQNQLLGIGMDADEATGETKGVKITMFDTSNPADVEEKHTFIMENVYSTDVFYDYKAALIDPEKNVIGFSAYEGSYEKYFVFSYDKKEGFQCQMSERVNGNSYRAARGIYIGEVLYVVKGNILEGYSMEDYSKLEDLIL